MTPDIPLRLPPVHASLMRRMILQAVIMGTFVIVVFTTVAFKVSQQFLERRTMDQVSSLAAAAEDAVESRLRLSREKASLLVSHDTVRSIFAGRRSSAELKTLLQHLQSAQEELVGIELSDAEGRAIGQAGVAVDQPDILPSSTIGIPVLDDRGWRWYDVHVPVDSADGFRGGLLSLRFSAHAAVTPLLGILPSLGGTAQTYFGIERDGQLILMRPALFEEDSYLLMLGDSSKEALRGLPLAFALDGTEGSLITEDYRGHSVLTGYRYLPSLGWSLVVQVDRAEALMGVRALARSIGLVGILLIALSAMLSYLLAKELTTPLRDLAGKVTRLHPQQWGFKRTVETGDEVEVLDVALDDLVRRLKHVYDHLEEEVTDRTVELKKLYARDRAILEGIGQGVVTVDKEGNVTGANPAAAGLLHASSEELIGQSVEQAIMLTGRNNAPLKGVHPVISCLSLRRMVRSTPDVVWNVHRKDGSLLPVLLVATPLLQGGDVIGAIVVFQDITQERQIDELKSEFISLASHQLRTPLSSVRWYAELIAEEPEHLTEDQKAHLMAMRSSLERMATLLTALLQAAHVEEQNFTADIRPTDLVAMLSGLQEEYGAYARDAHHSFELVVPGHKAMCLCDPILLSIVLQNLLTNALKYSAAGTQVQMGLLRRENRWIIEVKDCGIGIPQAEQYRIFQKFFRSKNVLRMDTDGNGLGLYITKSIMNRLGGDVSFDSVEGSGTVFSVTLPTID